MANVFVHFVSDFRLDFDSAVVPRVPLTPIHNYPKEPIGKLGEASIAQGDLPPYVIRGESRRTTRIKGHRTTRIHLTQMTIGRRITRRKQLA